MVALFAPHAFFHDRPLFDQLLPLHAKYVQFLKHYIAVRYAQPSAQPIGQSTGQPSTQPIGPPIGPPIGQSSGQPIGPPSAQSSGQPSGEPPGSPGLRALVAAANSLEHNTGTTIGTPPCDPQDQQDHPGPQDHQDHQEHEVVCSKVTEVNTRTGRALSVDELFEFALNTVNLCTNIQPRLKKVLRELPIMHMFTPLILELFDPDADPSLQ